MCIRDRETSLDRFAKGGTKRAAETSPNRFAKGETDNFTDIRDFKEAPKTSNVPRGTVDVEEPSYEKSTPGTCVPRGSAECQEMQGGEEVVSKDKEWREGVHAGARPACLPGEAKGPCLATSVRTVKATRKVAGPS